MGYHVGFVVPCLLVLYFFYWMTASWKETIFFCWPQTRHSHSEGRHWRHWNAIKMYIRGLLPQLVFPASSGAHAGALGFHLTSSSWGMTKKNVKTNVLGPDIFFPSSFFPLRLQLSRNGYNVAAQKMICGTGEICWCKFNWHLRAQHFSKSFASLRKPA